MLKYQHLSNFPCFVNPQAIKMANNSCYGLAASVWSENIGLALETAVSIRAGALWVNSHNMFDAAAGFGGYKESGYGREGGEEGLYAYLKPKWQQQLQQRRRQDELEAAKDGVGSWGKVDRNDNLPSAATSLPGAGASQPSIDRTPKMYVGGKQKRPDNGTVMSVFDNDGNMMSQVGDGSRKDVRDAVEAAHKAQGGWGKRAAHDRAQICFYIAENLSARKTEFAETIGKMTGKSEAECEAEVEESISRLFT
jgi:aldehyde dehydrogenase (NAD+)